MCTSSLVECRARLLWFLVRLVDFQRGLVVLAARLVGAAACLVDGAKGLLAGRRCFFAEVAALGRSRASAHLTHPTRSTRLTSHRILSSLARCAFPRKRPGPNIYAAAAAAVSARRVRYSIASTAVP
jgi:hypothetical protein